MTVQSYDARFFYVFLPTDDGFRGLAGRASDIYGVHVRIETVRGEREERGEGRAERAERAETASVVLVVLVVLSAVWTV